MIDTCTVGGVMLSKNRMNSGNIDIIAMITVSNKTSSHAKVNFCITFCLLKLHVLKGPKNHQKFGVQF